MKRNNKGFTLAELLIVVAIIAVLVAIAIPIFTTRLEQSRETTDIANLRGAYAAAQVAALSGLKGVAINPSTNAVYWYDPDDPEGLNATTGKALGQGTVADGHADLSELPTVCNSYQRTDNVAGMGIKVTFNSTAGEKYGLVDKIEFASVSGT